MSFSSEEWNIRFGIHLKNSKEKNPDRKINDTPDVFDFDAYFASLNNGGSGHSIGGDDGVVIIPEPPVIDDPINIKDPADRTLYANRKFGDGKFGDGSCKSCKLQMRDS